MGPTMTVDYSGSRFLSSFCRRFGGYPRAANDPAGMSITADGVAEVLAAVREQLRHGATQVRGWGKPSYPPCVSFFAPRLVR